MNEKGRQTKLLAAIAVLAMVVCAFIIVMPSESTSADITDNGESVTVTDGEELLEVIGDINSGEGEYSDVKTINLAAGEYNVTTMSSDNQWKMSGLYIVKDGITIRGSGDRDSIIYADYANGANNTVYGVYDSGVVINQQDMVAIDADNVTLENLTIMPMVQNPTPENKNTYVGNKGIEIFGDEATIRNVSLVPNTLGTYEDGTKSTSDTVTKRGGSICFNSECTAVEIYDVDITSGWITSYVSSEKTAVTMDDVVIDDTGITTTVSGNGAYKPINLTSENSTITAQNCRVLIDDWTFNSAYTNPAGVTLVINGTVTGGINNEGSIDMGSEATPGTITGIGGVTFDGASATVATDIDDVEAALGDDKDSIIYTGETITVDEATPITKPIVFGNLTSGTIYIRDTTATFNGAVDDVTIETIATGDAENVVNKAEISGVSGNFTITVGSIIMGGNIIEDGSGTSTIDITGDAYVDESFTIGEGITLTVTAGTTLEVPAGTTLIVNGTLVIESTGSITNNGTIINSGTTTIDGTLTNMGTIRNIRSIDGTGSLNNNGQIYSTTNATITVARFTGNTSVDGFGISSNMDAIQSDLPLSGYAFLTSDLTIPAGKSITVGSNAILDLQGYTLTVQGQLIVQIGGQIIGYDGNDSDNEIVLNGGSITNEGTIGSGEIAVTVSAANGSVSLLNVEGVNFGTTRVGGSTYLTVTGSVITAIGSNLTYAFGINNAYIYGNLTIGDGVETTITTGATVMRDATLTIDGTVNGDAIKMLTGSTVQVNGTCTAPISADTGKDETKDYDAPGTSTITLNNVTGVTLTVTSVTSVEQVNGTSTRFTTQILNIYGETDFVNGSGSSPSGSITVVNIGAAVTYVPEGQTLSLPDGITADLDGTTVVGTVEYAGDVEDVENFNGTRYAVREGTATTYYIREFSAALAEIANAYQQTVTVYGEVEVDGEIVLADGQTIAIDTSADFIVSENGKITVQDGARINGTVDEVTGLVFVERLGNVSSVAKYAVYTEGADGSRTFAGFAAAIANSQAGDRITVSGVGYDDTADNQLTVEDDVTIPADRTVIIAHSVYFEGDLTVDEGATVTNQNTITMLAEDATVTVNGTLDNTAAGASVAFDKSVGDGAENRNVYANGQYIVSDETDLVYQTAGGNPVTYAYVNGAYYQNEDGNIVVTTFSNAVAGAIETEINNVTVIGTVNESGEVAVDGGETGFTVSIGTEDISAEASLGTVTISNAQIIVAGNGELSAIVVGAYGVEGATSEATIAFSEVSNITVANTDDVNEMAETYWFNTITGFTGDVTISAGEVEINETVTSYTVDDNNKLTVASGATLVVPSEVTLNLNDNVDIAGTVSVEGTLSITGDATVNGTIDVQKDGEMSVSGNGFVLTGTLNIAEDTKSVTVSGTMRLGETPETLGSVSSDAVVTGTVTVTGKVIAYSGSDVSGASFIQNANTAAKYTTYTINGIEYATVYGFGDITDINEEIAGLKDLEVPNIGNESPRDYSNDIVWYVGENKVDTEAALGTYEDVSAEIAYATVNITMSVGTHITVSIDNIIVNGTTKDLAIGTHTVNVTVDPGYTGDVTITFDGQTVQNGGTITVTSDMIGETVVLSAIGQLSADTPEIVIPGSSSDDDGMGLTDYLLIILVILIVIMAIMVAFRLMRS